MTHLASRIIAHDERHATAWDADRHSAAWNDKVWHDLFVARLASGAKVLDLGRGSGRPVAQHMAGDEYAALLDLFGFDVIAHVANDVRAGGRTAWLCRRRDGRDRRDGA